MGGEKKYVGGRRKDDKEAVGERYERERESEGLVDGWVMESWCGGWWKGELGIGKPGGVEAERDWVQGNGLVQRYSRYGTV